ncbi:hypothetical protein [Carp edema virus]|nr:hypothetical protein [Carp edema virus]
MTSVDSIHSTFMNAFTQFSNTYIVIAIRSFSRMIEADLVRSDSFELGSQKLMTTYLARLEDGCLNIYQNNNYYFKDIVPVVAPYKNKHEVRVNGEVKTLETLYNRVSVDVKMSQIQSASFCSECRNFQTNIRDQFFRDNLTPVHD